MNNQLQSCTVFFVVLGVDGQSDVFLKYVVHTLYCAVVLISLMIMPPLHFLH